MPRSYDSAVSLRSRNTVLWFLLTALFSGWFSGVKAGEKSKSRFHALCVGLRYPGTGRELRFTTADVREVAKAFASSSGYDELSSNIVWMVDDDPGQVKPTPDAVRRRLSRMAEDSGPEDRVVFYFSGHGLRGANDRSILVCDDDGNGGDAGNLYVSEIRDILDQSPARDKLLIIDACHSGGKSVGEGLAPSSLAKSLVGTGKAAGRDTVAWLASCDVSEQSWEDEDTNQGLFTRFFLEAIGSASSEADVNFDGRLSVPELHNYISDNISYYIQKRKKNKDRDWLTRRQSPRMGMGGMVSLNGEELAKTIIFYCLPNSSTSSARPPATLLQAPSAKPPPELGVRYDPSMTLAQCREFAEKGDALAQCHLGNAYQEGKEVTRSSSEAVRWFRLAIDQGHAVAQNNLGYMYNHGAGVAKNYSEAIRLYRLSADQGYAAAQNNLGYMYEYGQGVAKNYSEAVHWYRLSADQDYAAAQYNLGRMYENGTGVAKNYSEAVRLYRLVADQGYALAQYNLGVMYENGRGVAKSYSEAVRLYYLAADQGNASANNNLGYLYQNGRGVAKSYSEAIRLYRLAADQGHASAQNNLGYMYENGNGVHKDLAEAIRFYRLAAAQGEQNAKKALTRLGSK